VYGKKYAHLRTKKFKKAFAEGRGLEETGLTPEIVSWMEKQWMPIGEIVFMKF